MLNPKKSTKSDGKEIPPVRRTERCWLLAGLALLAGCSTYHAKPLDAASVESALQPPTLEAIRVTSASFKHPLL
ncbi:MAG: hypothetical protein ABI222_02005, partial [Opitutaceae bacterium]